MRIFLFIIFVVFIFDSCKKSESPPPVVVIINKVIPPSAFTVTVIDRGTDYAVLNWTKSMATNNDSVVYNVYLGSNPVPVAAGLTSLTYTMHNLNPDSSYKGRIEAEDPKENRTSEPFHLDPFDGYFFAYDNYSQFLYKATLSASPVTPYSFGDDFNAPSGYSNFPVPAISGDTLFVSDLNAVTAVNLKTGSVLWSVGTPGSPTFSLLYANGVIYASCLSSSLNVVAINVAKQSIIWTFPYSIVGITSDPVIANNTIYFTNSNLLFAVNANNGSLLWSKVVANGIGRPSTDGKSVFVATQQNASIYSYDCSTGAYNWSYSVGSVPLNSCPVIHNGTIILVANNATVAVSTQNGSALWQVPSSGYPAFNGDTVFMEYSNKLHALNINTGNEIWSSTASYGLSQAVYAAGYVYFLFSTDAQSGPYVTKVATQTGTVLMTANRNGSGYYLSDLPPVLVINNQAYYGSTSAIGR